MTTTRKKNPADAPRSITVRAAKKRENKIKTSLEHKLYKLYFGLESRVAKLEAQR